MRYDQSEEVTEAEIESLKAYLGGDRAEGAVEEIAATVIRRGGHGKKVVFIVQFRTGQKMLVSADSKTYIAIQAAAMDAPAKVCADESVI